MRIGIAADHGGFELKIKLIESLHSAGHSVVDFGAKELNDGDDYPDYVVPLARAVAGGDVERGIAICGKTNSFSIDSILSPTFSGNLLLDPNVLSEILSLIIYRPNLLNIIRLRFLWFA